MIRASYNAKQLHRRRQTTTPARPEEWARFPKGSPSGQSALGGLRCHKVMPSAFADAFAQAKIHLIERFAAPVDRKPATWNR